MNLLDNVNHRLADDLRPHLGKNSRLAIAASSFSIYAFEALRQELQGIEGLRFVFTVPAFGEKSGQRETGLFGSALESQGSHVLNQRAIARECARWLREKATFKANRHDQFPLSGLIHAQGGDAASGTAWLNAGGFTTAGLGLTPQRGFPTLIQKTDFPNSQAYLDWFNQVWQDPQNLADVTTDVRAYLETAFRDHAPEAIYFLTLYNIFNDFLEDLSSGQMPDDRVGFRDTEIWNRLFHFQKDAVVGAINKLEKYKGCILADSVGLGKTFSALGVIKYYEMRNRDVLVLCPKKLEANWNTFRHNDTNNILAKDRLRYDVLFHTDLSRESGMSNGRNLAQVAWGNYGLVVIDESHNFRNAGLTYSDKENRYQKLLRKVIGEGVETKVLMLSATPVNNRFTDLKNQLALAYEGNPANLDAKLNTEQGIESIFKRAQAAFNKWSKGELSERTASRLLEALDFDFFELLDSLTIARSRKHITTYYDTNAIGKFPKRLKPVSVEAPLTQGGGESFATIATQLEGLQLCVYTPLRYLLPGRAERYARIYDKHFQHATFRQKDRENSLKKLMQINLLKRLESSLDSFRITLAGMLQQIKTTRQTLEKNAVETLATGIAAEVGSEQIDWEAQWGDEEAFVGKKVKVHLADIDRLQWAEDLKADEQLLQSIFQSLSPINAAKDAKLQSLIQHIEAKLETPRNAGNKKVIVFTAFADTANYLYQHVAQHFGDKWGLHTALITGSKRATTARRVPNDLNALLTCFSPVSKEKTALFPELTEEIDLLIATDCISEGQNLQDCDTLINFDIHWNPVRIIQRFGRIDRIGSRNETIALVNFWPDITLDAYINLKQRVEDRMLILDLAGTADDNILKEEQRDLEYRKLQLQKLKEEVTDLEDLREGIDITDLGLNDFRTDLANLLTRYGPADSFPEGLHTVVAATPALPPGVVFVLKSTHEVATRSRLNRLHPYCLVYIDAAGETVYRAVEAKKILDALRQLCKGTTEPIGALCEAVAADTQDYTDMAMYSRLLRKAVSSLLETEEEKAVQSLFRAGGTHLSKDHLRGIEHFRLVSFFIVKDHV